MSFVPLSRSQLRFIADEFWPGGGENDDGRDLTGVAKHEGVWREETLDADLIAEALHPADANYYDREGVADMDDEEFDAWLAEDDADEDDSISVNDQPLDEFLADFGDDSYREFDRRPRDEYDDLPDGEDGPDALELAITREVAIDPWCVVVPRRWNELAIQAMEQEVDEDMYGLDAQYCGLGMDPPRRNFCGLVATALERFERDGVRKQGVSAANAGGFRTKDDRRSVRPSLGPHWMYDPTTGYSGPNPRWNGRQRFDSWKRHRDRQSRLRQVSPLITDPAYRDAA